VVPNASGPAKQQLYLAGRPIRDFFWAPQSGAIGLGFAICSYNGRRALHAAIRRNLQGPGRGIPGVCRNDARECVVVSGNGCNPSRDNCNPSREGCNPSRKSCITSRESGDPSSNGGDSSGNVCNHSGHRGDIEEEDLDPFTDRRNPLS